MALGLLDDCCDAHFKLALLMLMKQEVIRSFQVHGATKSTRENMLEQYNDIAQEAFGELDLSQALASWKDAEEHFLCWNTVDNTPAMTYLLIKSKGSTMGSRKRNLRENAYCISVNKLIAIGQCKAWTIDATVPIDALSLSITICYRRR